MSALMRPDGAGCMSALTVSTTAHLRSLLTAAPFRQSRSTPVPVPVLTPAHGSPRAIRVRRSPR